MGQRWVRTERERGSATARRVAEAGRDAVEGRGTRGAEWGQKVAPDPEDHGGLGSGAEMVRRGLECAGDSRQPQSAPHVSGGTRVAAWLAGRGGRSGPRAAAPASRI